MIKFINGYYGNNRFYFFANLFVGVNAKFLFYIYRFLRVDKYKMVFYTVKPLVVFLIFFELLILNYFSTGNVDFSVRKILIFSGISIILFYGGYMRLPVWVD